ncbi:hypothetical protein [Nostoc sp. DedSLP04]|uniref:hypothetical protein n=1 Tax=Nostoc sp. DedSLP04 TaxID=3075401 RepID=UPI002AD33852|nr:hypothetical protein [Nostoc sp. DedSLP04]MDZ8032667.1 hypothetical protein [Nostoc sp. DedSLP04]
MQVSELGLRNRNWHLEQGNAYWPANDQRNHIHLGVPTSVGYGLHTRIAEDTNVFVTYVSIKINDQFYGRLTHDSQTGYFSWKDDSKALPNNYRQELTQLGILSQ